MIVIIAKLDQMKKSIRKEIDQHSSKISSVFAVTSHDLGLIVKYHNAWKYALSIAITFIVLYV